LHEERGIQVFDVTPPGVLKVNINMKKSTIQFEVELDENNIPTRILWDATDKPEAGMTETKSISVALWDDRQKNTLRIDLWAKDMPLLEMKRFHIDCLGGIAQTVLGATGDEHMSNEINQLCERLVTYLKEKKDH
jgi:gliding motility-associated protein GldC